MSIMYAYNQYGQDQRIIDLSIICPNSHSEFLLDDLTMAECQLEDLFAQGLIPFFDQIQIDDVSIKRSPDRQTPITITLRAQGFDPLLRAHNLDLLIEEKLTGALAELFN